jgi:hypothetical protein
MLYLVSVGFTYGYSRFSPSGNRTWPPRIRPTGWVGLYLPCSRGHGVVSDRGRVTADVVVQDNTVGPKFLRHLFLMRPRVLAIVLG